MIQPREARRVTVTQETARNYKCGDRYLTDRGMCPHSALLCDQCGLWLSEPPSIGDDVVLYTDGTTKVERRAAPNA